MGVSSSCYLQGVILCQLSLSFMLSTLFCLNEAVKQLKLACFKQTWSAWACACHFLAHYAAVSFAWSILFIRWVWPPFIRLLCNCFLISGTICFHYMTGQHSWTLIRMTYIPIRHLYCKANFYITLFYHLYIASFVHDRNINAYKHVNYSQQILISCLYN